MTNAGRVVEQASIHVMFPGHISLVPNILALCLTNLEASAVSAKHKLICMSYSFIDLSACVL